MKIEVASFLGDKVLAGASNGKNAFAKFVAALDAEPNEPTPLFLDFSGVEVATASFLREFVFSGKAYMRKRESNYYPVVANCNGNVRDELVIIATSTRDVIMTCRLGDDEVVYESQLIGDLETKQKLAYQLVVDMNGADAGRLNQIAIDTESGKSPTVWNNRLSALVSKGILREFPASRGKFYKPLFSE